MNDKLNQIFSLTCEYLEENGWKKNGWQSEYPLDNLTTMGHYIDPITGLSHRTDFAFFIQIEREVLKKHLFPK